MEAARERAGRDTRTRILDVAAEILGREPDAGMGDIATAAGVVRRTVYGHFPSRADLVLALARQAGEELTAILGELDDGTRPPDEVWAHYVVRLWPLAARYRVLLALRRSEHGDEIHTLLNTPEGRLAQLVARGQEAGTFGHHLPAGVLSRVTHASVFTLADQARDGSGVDVAGAVTASLYLLGVRHPRVRSLSARAR